MKKRIFALPILFLAVCSNAYGEEDGWSRYDFTTRDFVNRMVKVRTEQAETVQLRKISDSFRTSSSVLDRLESLRPTLSLRTSRREYRIVLTDDPGRIALQLQWSFN